jgi:hypothetical protein
LPYRPADAHCHHAEEQDPHPRRDIAEDFASGVIHGLQTFPKSLLPWSEQTFWRFQAAYSGKMIGGV